MLTAAMNQLQVHSSVRQLQQQSVYLVFEDEKSNGSDEKSVMRKIEKTDRTNKIAANFV